jgi:hypothetical protein
MEGVKEGVLKGIYFTNLAKRDFSRAALFA